MNLVSPREILERKRSRTIIPLANEQWYDVQDENGKWRVGYCQRVDQNYKVISLDGFHPCHTAFFCQHSGKILPIRTKTKGLTVPEQGKTLRKVLNIRELEQVSGKLSLFQLRSNQLQNTPESIRSFIRTQLLITIDKIFNTPYEIIGCIKMVDIHINKLFINVIEYYLKLLESSKKFISSLDSNETARELYRATYEMANVISMILGVHKRSKAFYQNSANRTVTSEGFVDCFIKSQAGVLPFKLFFKNSASLKHVDEDEMVICLETMSLFIAMCESYQKELIEGKFRSTACLIVEEIITLLKIFCDKNPENCNKIKAKVQLISRIQTLYFKLFPNKQCNLRRIFEKPVEKENQKEKEKQREKQKEKDLQLLKNKFISEIQIEKNEKKAVKQEKENQRIKQLENKIQSLENSVSRLQTINLHGQNLIVNSSEPAQIIQPMQNLGEEAFLGSLEWALDAGDISTCKKLVSWRKSLLKLGRITGWEIALSVGMKTFKKKQITTDDIIEANYQFILKQQKNA